MKMIQIKNGEYWNAESFSCLYLDGNCVRFLPIDDGIVIDIKDIMEKCYSWEIPINENNLKIFLDFVVYEICSFVSDLDAYPVMSYERMCEKVWETFYYDENLIKALKSEPCQEE